MLTALAIALAGYSVAGLVGLGGRRAIPVVIGIGVTASLVAGLAALRALIDGAIIENGYLPIGLPWLGAHFRADALAEFFLVVVNFGAALIGVYALPYLRHEAEPSRILPFMPWFVAAMNLVIVADDAYTFLLAWELMSLSSWLLVLNQHRDAATRSAALLYLVMASIGTGALLLAFGLMAGGANSYAFSALRDAHLGPARTSLVFALALVGTGSKAGMVPLHVWLPPAHAAAPSPVSALMSGIMTKVAIYGLIRILFDLVGSGSTWWWGIVVLVLGGITALAGVLYAVLQRDIKRLLAYSTVENIGFILAGLGLAIAFRASHLDALATLALSAALLHVFNHAAFKSLLFLGAGAVITATGVQDLERLGGLIHRLPRTAFVFLIGAVSISALPPFNGFVSEWLVFQGVINGATLPQWPAKFAAPIVGAMLALAAALAAVAFVKAFGIGFLGRPRSTKAAEAKEVGLLMIGPMAVLAIVCTLAGIAPKLVLDLIRPATSLLLPSSRGAIDVSNWLWLAPLGLDRSSYGGVVILAGILGMTTILVLAIHRLASSSARRAPAWDCGFPDPRPETQYTASSFSQPIRRVFGTSVFAATEIVDMPRPDEIRAAKFESNLRDPAWDLLYRPVIDAVNWLADRLNMTQYMTIRRYLGMMFGALVFLLLLVAVTQ